MVIYIYIRLYINIHLLDGAHAYVTICHYIYTYNRLSYIADLSNIPCGCNGSLYGVFMPAINSNGNNIYLYIMNIFYDNIENSTLKNNFYRKVIYTSNHM